MKVSVVGLGYVGLPVGIALAEKGHEVSGYDVDKTKILELNRGYDRTGEVEKLNLENMIYTHDPSSIKNNDFVLVTVPTPIDKSNQPDLTILKSASKTIGENLSKNSIVVYESTVYPGCTEEVCVPILEKYSGMKCGIDFKVGYSPERINPGDKKNTIDKVVKVVSAMDEDSLEKVVSLYSSITKVHATKTIKEAEAAKIIENTQRDLNIALMNELAQLFDKDGIDIQNVLEAAGTKWNFLNFTPGLVGGHCIGVDPYYLVHRAETLGYHPQIISAGRRINDNMHKFYAEKVFENCNVELRQNPVINVLGLTFKEDVNDLRNSKTFDLIHHLQKTYGLEINAHDPLLPFEQINGVKNKELQYLRNAPVTILSVPHQEFLNGKYESYFKEHKNSKFLDLKGAFKKRYSELSYI